MASTGKLPRLQDLRVGDQGSSGSFEEFCCQLFRRAPEAPSNGQYRRIRGAGGDGGVEAVWILNDGAIWGIQAKFFSNLRAPEKAQIGESIRQATANYPNLKTYTICLPFVLTGRKGAVPKAPSGRKLVKGQHETFAEWLAEWQAALAKEGRSIEFQLWDESSLMMRLAAVDTTGGLRRYWFEQETFSSQWFRDRLQDAVAQAGPRYSPELSVATPLEDALHAFGRSEVWAERVRQVARRYSDKVDWWRRTAEGRTDDLLTAIPQIFSARAKALLGAAEIVDAGLDTMVDSPEWTCPAFVESVFDFTLPALRTEAG
jgi:hypothetical protein